MMGYPYIGAVMKDYLTAKLPGIRVVSKVPAQRPTRLVRLNVIPGSPSDKPEFLAWRRVTFHVWDDNSEEDAGALAETVASVLLASRYERIGVRKVELFGPGRYDDPDDPAPRFQITADFMLRANV